MEKKKKHSEDYAGLFIPGGLLAGMGFGFLFDNLVAYMFIGLGAGFIVMAITKMIEKAKGGKN